MSAFQRKGVWFLSVVIAATAGVTCAATGAPAKTGDFPKLKKAAAVDFDTAEGMTYIANRKEALQAAISAAFAKCRGQAPAGTKIAFEFVAGIGPDGAPQEVLVRPENPFGACFANEFPSNKIGVPPKQPFHIYVNMGAGH